MFMRRFSTDTFQNVVLAQRPQVTSTITSLPLPLLDSLLPQLSTLSSVYQKLPSSFLGQGRSGALQQAAIEEAAQHARENPIAAVAAAAAVTGQAPVQNNAENLLDIDFDGAAPASMQKAPIDGNGLEGLAGTPQRVASPMSASGMGGGGMDDLMGVFGSSNGFSAPSGSKSAGNDLLDGFASLDMNSSQPTPPQQQLDGGAAQTQRHRYQPENEGDLLG